MPHPVGTCSYMLQIWMRSKKHNNNTREAHLNNIYSLRNLKALRASGGCPLLTRYTCEVVVPYLRGTRVRLLSLIYEVHVWGCCPLLTRYTCEVVVPYLRGTRVRLLSLTYEVHVWGCCPLLTRYTCEVVVPYLRGTRVRLSLTYEVHVWGCPLLTRYTCEVVPYEVHVFTNFYCAFIFLWTRA
jgi:hypothetical protein